MGKISSYASALKAKLTDYFVIASDNNGVLETKKVTTEQIGDAIASDQTHSLLDTSDKTLIGGINENVSSIGTLSSLTTTDKSSIVGAVNSLNSASLKASELRVIRETKTTNSYGTIDSNSLTGGAIPLSRTILSAYSPSGYFVKIGYYSSRYTFDVYDSNFQLVRNTAVEVCIVSTADLTK